MQVEFGFRQVGSDKDYHEIELDGRAVNGYAWGPPPFRVVVLAKEWPRDVLLTLTPNEIQAAIAGLELLSLRGDWPNISSVGLSDDREYLYFMYEFDLANWKGRWSAVEYANAYAAVIGKRDAPTLKFEPWDEITSDGFSVLVGGVERDVSFGQNIDKLITVLAGVEADALSELGRHSDALTLEFAFPPEVKSACEQYLLYFGEFLRDCGLAATSELNETEYGVLFSVKPAGSRDALNKVRQAFDLYLRLPGTAFATDTAIDIQAQKLIANIRHLEGQLALARAVMQAQKSSIEAQQVTIGLLNGTVSLKALAKTEQEDILGGVISIVPYEGKGFTIDLPEMFRRLRKLFQE